MKTRYACALDGVELHDLDERIHITDIVELAPCERLVTAPNPGGGMHVLRHVREHLTVRIHFIIREYSILGRRAILERVCAWAGRGGILTTNERNGQHLRVICTALPWTGAMAWLDELTLELTAYAVPYWEDDAPVQLAATVPTDWSIPGSASESPVSVEVVNQSTGYVMSLTLQVGRTSMTFRGLSLPAGGTFRLIAEDGRVQALVGDQSALLYRTPESDDMLLAACGQVNVISATADQTITATFTTRGRHW